jgi:benzoyl-CoA reductase subunit C
MGVAASAVGSDRTTSVLESLRAVVREPYALAKSLKVEKQRRITGYFCTYAPEELFDAAGWLPVRLLPDESQAPRVETHLQSFACSLARSCLGAALSSKFDFLDAIVFPQTCDTMQNLADIWRESVGAMAHFTFMVPARADSLYAREFLVAELERVKQEIEQLDGQTIPREKLLESISVFNENRSAVRKLYELRRANPETVRATDFQTAVEAGFFMPKRDHAALVTELLSALEEHKGDIEAKLKPRIFVAGGICYPSRIIELIESMGATVVDDDLCTGWRYVSADTPTDLEPLEALAKRLLDRVPCPSKHRDDFTRADYLLDKVRTSGAQGVVFHFLKYCDPWAFEYPNLRERLQREGLPTLLLETELGAAAQAQVRTRLQAFIEMLG